MTCPPAPRPTRACAQRLASRAWWPAVGAVWAPSSAFAATAPASGSPALWIALGLLAGALAALAGSAVAIWRERQRVALLQQQLQQARQIHSALGQTLDVWQWHTDAAHKVVACRPPRGASSAAWSTVALGSALWEQFVDAEGTALRTRLEAHGELDDLPVKQAWQAADAPPSRLRGVPLTDRDGQFAGHVGTLRDALPAGPALPLAPAALPPLAPTQADADHEAFSYTVSHDLRAPIRVVEGFTKILKEDYGRLLDRIGNDHLDRVLSAAARMNHMIDALLTLSQLSSQPLGRQWVDLSQLARYIAEDLRRQSPEREVQVHIAPGLQALGDPTLLRVVLENLLGNAWKYTGRCAQAQIWLERHPESAVTYTVRDNGAGFDMRFADRLFGMFQRLHSANDFQGTGVGLASVRRIVRRHGGDIWAESEVDQGARFHFSLSPDSGRVAGPPGTIG